MNEENITNEELLKAVKDGFAKTASKEDLRGMETEIKDIRKDVNQLTKDVDILKEGAFTKDEKEDVLIMVENINQRLEDETLGKKSITLTRSEYDNASNTEGFENRFEKANSSYDNI